jgi:NADH-quinone oxidoreductase subunit N
MVMTVGHAKAERIDKFELPVLFVLATLGMLLMISANDMIALYMGLELQSPGALCGRRDQPRRCAAVLDGSRAEILRPRRACRRACCFTAHRWSTATPATTGFDEMAEVAIHRRRTLARPDLRPGVPAARACRLQDLRRALPHVDAGRLRGRADPGDRVLRRRARRWPPWRCSCGSCIVEPLGEPVTLDWQQIIIVTCRSLSMVLGAFAAIGQKQHQAADGLFLDRRIWALPWSAWPRALGGRGARRASSTWLIYMVMTLGTFACILCHAGARKTAMVEQIDWMTWRACQSHQPVAWR